MKVKLLILIALIMLAGETRSDAAYYSWRQRISSACTALTDGNLQDMCWDTSLKVTYTCSPATGSVCSAPADWKAGGGGWIDNGTNLYPLNLSRNVGIGTLSPLAKLDVNGNLHIGSNMIQCDASNGCKFDADNNGASDITFSNTGVITTGGGFVYTGSNPSLNVTRSTDKTGPSTGDLWYNSSYPAFVYSNGTILKRIPTEEIFSTTITPSASSNKLIWKAPYNIKIETINCIVDPGGTSSAVINIQNCNSNGSACASVDTSSITCGNTNSADDGNLSSPTVNAGNWVNLNLGTVTGSPANLTITVKYSLLP